MSGARQETTKDWARSPAALVAAAALGIAGVSGLIHAWRSPGVGQPAHTPQTGVHPPAPSARVLIDPNAASADELAMLPTIGPVLAQRIVEDRGANGPYTHLEDLRRVKGIGPRTIDAIRAHTTLAP